MKFWKYENNNLTPTTYAEEWDTEACELCEHYWDGGMSLHFRRCLKHSTCVDCWNCKGKDLKLKEEE